jgi:hypothetical protein
MEKSYNNIIEELKAIAPEVAGADRQNLYFVPDDYFDSLSRSVLTNIKLTHLKPAANPYSVPAGYFESLSDSILHKIDSSSNEVYKELSDVAPLLNTISKRTIFSIPQGYFENLQALNKIETKATKIVSIGSHIRKWMTYAAAASVLFIIATTAYLYIDIHGQYFEKQLPVEQKISKLNDQEIINYLKDNDGILSGAFISVPDEQDSQIQTLLKNASDEDIQNYLDNYSDPDGGI